MAIPLIVLAIGSIVAGYVGVPHAIGGNNRIERFLEPSFAVSSPVQKLEAGATQAAEGRGQVRPVAVQETHATEAAGGDESTELKLMMLSSGVAIAGIVIAWYFWQRSRSAADAMSRRLHGVYTLLLHKYYVDEIYDATVIRGYWALARGLYRFDATFIDGFLVNGTRNVTVHVLSLGSNLFDKYVVDGLVNLTGRILDGFSRGLRRLQTGYVANYALILAMGMFALVVFYMMVLRRG